MTARVSVREGGRGREREKQKRKRKEKLFQIIFRKCINFLVGRVDIKSVFST